MYHAKHPEAARRPGYYTASGAFMGFGSEDESSENEDIERVSWDPDSLRVASIRIRNLNLAPVVFSVSKLPYTV
jgi:hypothetical protein